MGIQTPIKIEAFDNSNIQGGIQCQSNGLHLSTGKPDKKNYRKYKIKTVKGPDDYKINERSSKTTIFSRFKRRDYHYLI